jgi:quinol monooxygenase YgiN
MRSCFLSAVISAALSLASICARAQQEETPLLATSYIEIVPAAAAAAETILAQLAESARREEGTLAFETARLTFPSNQFVIFEAWKTQQAYGNHLAAESTKRSLAALGSQSIAPIDAHPARPVVKEALLAAPVGTVYGVSHVAVLAEKIDEFYAGLIQHAATTRQAAGNLRYYPVQDASRRNHFMIIEVWKDQASEDAYEAAAPAKAFRAALGPIQGPLYDRRWYKPF